MLVASCDTVVGELKTAPQGSSISDFLVSGAKSGGDECCERLEE